MNFQNLKFSYNTNSPYSRHNKNAKVGIQDIIDNIKNPKLIPPDYNNIYALHNKIVNKFVTGDDVYRCKSMADRIKRDLGWYQFSGFQERGHSDAEIQFNGCVQIDIDLKYPGGERDAIEYKKRISRLPYVILCGISPSKFGIKVLVHTDNISKEKDETMKTDYFKDSLLQVIDDIQSYTKLDREYFDILPVSQICYHFYDPNLYYNLEAETFKVNWDYVERCRKERVEESKFVTINFIKNKYEYTVLNDRQIKKYCDIAFKKAVQDHGHNYDTLFLTTYSGVTNCWGVNVDNAIYYLRERGITAFLTNKRVNSIKDIYIRYKADYGTFYNDLINKIEFKDKLSYNLSSDDKLSCLNLDLSKNSIIKSPTGSGKSYYVANSIKDKKVLTVQTQSLVEQFELLYGATSFYEKSRDITNKNDFYVTTYASLPQLGNIIDFNEFVLFVDEGHNFTSSSSPTYLLSQLTKVLDLTSEFKNYHLLTATPLYNYDKRINDLRLIEITQPLSYIKNLYYLKYKDRLKTILEYCTRAKKKDEQVAILFNNTKLEGQLGKLVSILSDFKVGVINATNKNDEAYRKVAIQGDMSDYDVIITTTVLKEGNSITKHSDNIHCLILGNFHPVEIEQYCSRFRNLKTLNAVLLRPYSIKDNVTNFYLPFCVEDIQRTIIAQKPMAEWAYSIKDRSADQNQFSDIILKTHYEFTKNHYRFVNGEVIADKLAMSNYVFEIEKRVANEDLDYMSRSLNVFGFQEVSEFSYENVLTITQKEKVEKEVHQTKIQIQSKTKEILNELKNETIEENNECLKDKSLSKLEQDIRFKAAYISNFTENQNTLEQAVEKLEEIGTSTRAFNNLKKAINIHKLTTNKSFLTNNNNPYTHLFSNIYKTFSINKLYSSNEIMESINNILSESTLNIKPHSKTKATRLLKTFMCIKRVQVRENDKRKNYYKIINHNPTNLNIDYDKHYSNDDDFSVDIGDFMSLLNS